MEQHYPFTLPPLPYGYDALAPELIEKVLYFHHDKHFAAYVDALNQLLERTPAYQSWPLWKLCLNWEELPDGLRQAFGTTPEASLIMTCISAPSTPCRSPPRTRHWRALWYGTSAAWQV